MELDEMKSLWADLSLQVEKQDKIQKELLMEITKKKFRSKLNAIRIPEIIGSLFCVGYAMYLLSHFSDFELWYNQIFALISIFILLALPTASLSAINGMRNLKVESESPSKILEEFLLSKQRFLKVQRYSIVLGGILMLALISPIAELNGSIEKISNPIFWLFYLIIGPVFMYILSKWAYKKYKGTIDSSEKMLQELE
ncbi:hypothetical protein [Algoriphagus chordae]|uniref:Uncharacterized protein n=1 Tax=Algoriphagus chordae TaxID=237019 RepID=A0A2W7RML8_9BACT|nr:hypothetical protein [Algoriphagus chordae]PZX51955.1 hypothetical protein LV85_02104 [Algoriphagus chordae]